MDFFIFRISLKATQNLFAATEDGARISREQWLRRAFSETREFVHFNNDFVFVPEIGIEYKPLIFGWIARSRRVNERTPPEEGLEPTERDSWQASFVAIDPSEHSEGQKIAMEYSQLIGSPGPVLSSFFRALEQAYDTPYAATIFPLTDDLSFWGFANAHGNRIRAVTFDVASPNMFNDRNDFQNELRQLRDHENVSRVKTTLESDSVLNTSSERLRDIVDYTERGAGSLSAVAEDGTVYSSGEHPKKIPLNVEHHNKSESEFLRQIVQLLDRLFP